MLKFMPNLKAIDNQKDVRLPIYECVRIYYNNVFGIDTFKYL